MRALAAVLLFAGCQIDLDSSSSKPKQATCTVNTVSQSCIDAANASDFTFVKTKIFDANCFGSACHEATGSAKLKFSKDVSQSDAYANLMNYKSTVDPNYMVVVPGDPMASYMMLMVQKIPPAQMTPPAADPPKNIGYMPQANPVLCCQKQDAIQNWIAAGAMND